MAPEEVPVGELVKLYEGMTKAGVSQAERLGQAEELAADEVARMFEADVAAFADYRHPDLPFHSDAEDRDKVSFHPRSKTRVVAAALKLFGESEVAVAGRPELSFDYADREVVTARTPGAYFGRDESGKPRPASGAPKLDLLLANAEDKTPIVAELKVGEDRDPFYALIQALAHAAMLVTPNQLERLHEQYPGAFDPDASRVDVYVVLVGSAQGTNWPKFNALAETLGKGVMESSAFTGYVRRIAEVKLDLGASVGVAS